TVDRGLQENLFDLINTETVATSGFDVHGQFIPVFPGDHGREGDRRTHATIQARTGPDGAPRVAGDHLLEILGERIGVGIGAVNVCIGEYFASHGHAGVVDLTDRLVVSG